MSHFPEGSPNFRNTPNSRLAAVAAALAIGAGISGDAEAKSSDGFSPLGIEAVESPPIFRSKQILLEKLAKNEIPNRVLNIAITFSINPDKPSFYYAPSNDKQPRTTLGAYKGVKRKYWIGQYPRYIRSHGEDWLAFLDIDNHRADPLYDPLFGPAKDTQNTLFLKASDMPDDTRILSFSRSGISPARRVLPARVDKKDNIVVKGLPVNSSELMLGFARRKEVNDIVSGLGLVPSKLRSLEDLK